MTRALDSLEVVMRGTSEPESPALAQWMADRLISLRDIRVLFELGRTAAYELTHRPGFPEPVVISPRCYRWWASEVTAFASTLRGERTKPRQPAKRATEQRAAHSGTPPLRIHGTVRAARTRRTAS